MLRHLATSSLPAKVEGQVVNRQTGAQNSLGKENLGKGSEILVAYGPKTRLGGGGGCCEVSHLGSSPRAQVGPPRRTCGLSFRRT